MNEDKLRVLLGDAASIDGYGYAQKENKTVVKLNQHKGLICWSQNGNGSWAGDFRRDQHSPPTDPGGVSHPKSVNKL